MRLALAIALSTALVTPAWSQAGSVSSRPDATTVVIYRFRPVDTSSILERTMEEPHYAALSGVAMIVESRTIDLPAGDGVIRLEGLATGVIPETAVIDGLPAEILERSADFELLSPGSLLEHSIGETIRVVRTNRETGDQTTVPAIVRSGAAGPVLEIEGRLEPLSCQGQTRQLIFERVPEGLGDKPVLSVRTRAPAAGRYTVRLAYLATGLNWSADYVARLAPDGASMDIEGWITLMNFGGTGFSDARVQVVAGNLNRDGDTEAIEPAETRIEPRCWPMDTTTRNAPGLLQVQREELIANGRSLVVDHLATIAADPETEIDEVVVTGSRILPSLAALGDYKIYTLPERTDLDALQAKQLRFFDQPGVRFTRAYQVFFSAWDDDEGPFAPQLLLRLRNEASEGLGLPMPGGGVSLVEAQDGVTVLTGQASFLDKGEGVPVELQFGEAMGLLASYEVTDRQEWEADAVAMQRASFTATLTNDKDWPVEIEVLPPWSGYPGFRILEQSRRSEVNGAGDTVWRVPVPAHGSAALSFTVQSED